MTDADLLALEIEGRVRTGYGFTNQDMLKYAWWFRKLARMERTLDEIAADAAEDERLRHAARVSERSLRDAARDDVRRRVTEALGGIFGRLGT